MHMLFFILYLLSAMCFGASAIGLWPKFNLMAAGLFLLTLVLVIQVGSRL